MDSNSEKTIGSVSSLKPYSESFDIKNIFLEQNKLKPKNTKAIRKNNRLYEHQRKKGDFKYLEKYVHKHFINLYKNSKNDYNLRMIEDILNNESTHLVAEFKDYLIMGDITEFLQKSYNINECKKYLPKIYEYYISCSVIFPNYSNLHESKYIYKNIRKKQKVIDNQQEQEEKQEKIKKGNIKLENNEVFFTTRTFNSILDQTNTSNVKYFFGLNDKIDANETPNDIVAKLEKAEKEATKRKNNLVKNYKNARQLNNIIQDNNNTTNNIKMNNNNNNNNNSLNNKNKIYNKNKPLKESNKTNNNLNNLTGGKKKNNEKLNEKINEKINKKLNEKTNHYHTKSNIDINNNIKIEKNNKIQINNYISKNQSHNQSQNINKVENNKSNYVKSHSNFMGIPNDNHKKNIYINSNNINNIKKQEIRKFLLNSNNNNNNHQIYFRNANHSNKNMKRQIMNSLFPSKSILTTIFNNYDNNNNSTLKNNSCNLLNRKSPCRNNSEINQINGTPGFSPPSSSITIQTNPFKNKSNYNININIKEPNTTKNINIDKLNDKSKEKLNIKNKRNKVQNHIIDYNNNTIAASTTSKTNNNKDKIKYIHKNKNFVYNKAQMNNNSTIPNYKIFRTIGNTSPTDIKINNSNKKNIININNINNSNNYMINNLNFHKIHSTTNIQNPMNMNININMNNNNKNKIFFNEASSSSNIMPNKIYSKSPLSIELETIKVAKKNRKIYSKSNIYTDALKKTNNTHNHNYNQIIYTNYNSNTISNSNNTLLNNKNYYMNSLNHNPIKSRNINEDVINNRSNNSNKNNYINNIKNNFLLDDLYKKKNIIVPFNKEINNINININGYNVSEGQYSSTISNNISKKKYKRTNNVPDINICNSENIININKNKIIRKNNNNNFISRNEGNPFKMKKQYDSMKNYKNMGNIKNNGYLSARKK